MKSLRHVLVVLALAPSAWAQQVTDKGMGRVDVNAEGAPLGSLVEQIRLLVPMDALLIDPAIAGAPVSVTIENTPGAEALMEVLGASKQNFAVLGGGKVPFRVYVGERTFAFANRETGSGEGATVAQGEGPVKAEDAQRARLVEAQAAQEREANEEASRQREAEAVPIVVNSDPKVPGGYTMVGESVVYNDPNFVPYKKRADVKAKRMAVDVSKIP